MGNYWLLKHGKSMQECSYYHFLVIVFVQVMSFHSFRGDHGHTYFSECKKNKLKWANILNELKSNFLVCILSLQSV